MNRRRFHFLPAQALIGLCLAVLSVGPGSGRADEPAQRGTLSGRVVDLDGKLVTGAHVWIDTYDNKKLAEGSTNAAGRFRLGPVAPVYRHPFTLMIDAERLARHAVACDGITFFPGVDHNLGTIALVQGRRFTGQVVDTDGKPKANIEVECFVRRHYLGHTVSRLGPSWNLTTDAEGRFRTPSLPVGELVVTVRVPGRQVGHAWSKIAPGGEETLEPIRLQEDVPIPGSVRDEQGKPVAGAKIRAYPGDSRATSDAEGKFVLRGFGPNPWFQMHMIKEGYVFGNYGVAVSKDGFKVNDVGADNKPARTMKDLSITLQRVAWMEGRAVDADTGGSVRLEKVILCGFERKSNGEIVRRG